MKKVEAIFLSDIHIDRDNSELVKAIINQAVGLCKRHKTSNLICGGDIFNNRSGQPLFVLITLLEIFEILEEAGIKFYVIPGNHDKTDATSFLSYLNVFNNNSLFLASTAEVVKIGSIYFHLVPYFKEEVWVDHFETVKKEIVKNSVNILITHIGITGVKNNDGSSVENNINAGMFKGYDKVLIGHYHDASKLSNNIFYTGSAYQTNYGENVSDKGFTVIYSDGSIEFAPSIFPKYIKEYVDINDTVSVANLLEKYEDNVFDHIRFIFKGKKSECEKINVAELSERGIDVKFESDEQTEAMKTAESDEFMNYDKKGLIKEFILFCKDNEIKGDKFKLGLELIKFI